MGSQRVSILAQVASVSLLASAGCPAGSDVYTGAVASGHGTAGRQTIAAAGTTTSAATGSSGSTGVGASSTGAASTGGSTGTTGAFVPPACDGGFTVQGTIVQLPLTADTMLEPFTQPIQVTNYFNPAEIADSDQQGDFAACVAPHSQLAWEVTAQGYISMVLATSLPTQNLVLPPMSAIGSTYLPVVLQACSVTNSNGSALVVISVEPTRWDWAFSKVDPDTYTDCFNRSGWTFTLTDADGGALDTQLYYFSGTGCGVDSTGSIGVALALVPSSLGQIGVIGTRANNQLPDGGLLCFNAGADPHFALTGQSVVAANLTTFIPYVIRAATYVPPGGPCESSSDCQGASTFTACLSIDGGAGACCYVVGAGCTDAGQCCAGSTCVAGPDGGLCQ